MGTPGKRMQAEVLAVLRQNTGPLSAYGVLDALRAGNPKLAPQTVYRALKGLRQAGRVHRLESLNVYIACRSDPPCAAPILSICDDCGAVEERLAPDALKVLSGAVERSGFSPRRHVIEIHGVCAQCEPSRADAPQPSAGGRT